MYIYILLLDIIIIRFQAFVNVAQGFTRSYQRMLLSGSQPISDTDHQLFAVFAKFLTTFSSVGTDESHRMQGPNYRVAIGTTSVRTSAAVFACSDNEEMMTGFRTKSHAEAPGFG